MSRAEFSLTEPIPLQAVYSPITEHEIRLAVFKQKNGKASGPYELSAEIIKGSYDIISPYLVKIFNTLFDNSQYPDDWGVGFIVPIFKGGDPTTAKSIVESHLIIYWRKFIRKSY